MFQIPSNISQDWENILETEFAKDYAQDLSAYLEAEKASGKKIFPEKNNWFRAFTATPMNKIKCVIIGQDPYHGANQANGLAFSVNKQIKIPPSLRNIKKELETSLKIATPEHGDLSSWSDEGVLLLNASLTVEEGKAGSHLNHGWLTFTENIISTINERCDHVVFLSWGAFSHNLTKDINTKKHCLIKTTHPSPLGATRPSKNAPAFIGSQCFKQVNDWLISKGQTAIDWSF